MQLQKLCRSVRGKGVDRQRSFAKLETSCVPRLFGSCFAAVIVVTAGRAFNGCGQWRPEVKGAGGASTAQREARRR